MIYKNAPPTGDPNILDYQRTALLAYRQIVESTMASDGEESSNDEAEDFDTSGGSSDDDGSSGDSSNEESSVTSHVCPVTDADLFGDDSPVDGVEDGGAAGNKSGEEGCAVNATAGGGLIT